MEKSEKTVRVDLWMAREHLVGDENVAELRTLLSPAERARADRYRGSDDTRRSILGRGIARLALAERGGLEASDLAIAVDERGQPHLIDGADDLRFSITHTTGLVAVAVATVPLGVDAEWLPRRTDRELVARRWYHPDEVAELAELDEESRARRFFEFWTLKEAYSKALGLGLAIPLKEIRFFVGDELCLDQRGERVEAWTFQLLRPAEEHQAALAVDAPDIELVTRWWPVD